MRLKSTMAHIFTILSNKRVIWLFARRRTSMESWTHEMHFNWEVTLTHETKPNTFYMGHAVENPLREKNKKKTSLWRLYRAWDSREDEDKELLKFLWILMVITSRAVASSILNQCSHKFCSKVSNFNLLELAAVQLVNFWTDASWNRNFRRAARNGMVLLSPRFQFFLFFFISSHALLPPR